MKDSTDEPDYLWSNGDIGYDSVAQDAGADDMDFAAQQENGDSKQSLKNCVVQTEDSLADVAMEQASEIATSKETEGNSDLGHGSLHGALEDEEMRKDEPHSQNGELGNDTTTPSLMRRRRAIEIVLNPPADPDSFLRIPRSQTILRVSGEIEKGDETYYQVEFWDGRMKHASYDDVVNYRGGRAAVETYERMFGLNVKVKNPNKRPRSEDEYEESGSDYDNRPKRSKRHESGSRQTRRSTRHTSRQISADPGPEEFESDSEGSIHQPFGKDDGSDDETKQISTRSRASVIPSHVTRQTRSRNSTGKNSINVTDSEDELAGDDDYGVVKIVSDLLPSRRRSKRKTVRPRARIVIKRAGSDSSIEFETTRRSGRSTKNVRSMKDPEIDEYDVFEERQTGAPKHAAIKEIFQQLDPDSSFRKMHSETCESCLAEFAGAKDPLVHCQGCCFSYHKACIGPRAQREHRVTKVGHEEFVLQCKFCIQGYKKKDKRAPDHAKCQVCKISGSSCAEFSVKKTPKQEEKARIDNGGEDPITQVGLHLVNNADNVLFRCTGCKRGYHFNHLPALTANMEDDQVLSDSRLEEYAMAGWICKDCIDVKSKIHSLVAWRPVSGHKYTGQTNQHYDDDGIEYLIRWTGQSHFHDTWMPGAWVFGIASGPMRQAFHKRESSTYPKMEKAHAIEEEWLLADVLLNVKYRIQVRTSSKAEDLERIDDITSIFVKFQGLGYDEVVWDEPPAKDSGAPYEAFVTAYDEYLNGKYFVTVPDYKMRERILLYRSLDFGKECELKSQPRQLKRGKLMDYQMEGVNFLLYNFHQQRNVILADEMGLGKTVQIVAFISALTHSKPCCWPFLVVVPNATCPNWRRELKQWAPDLRVVTYHGGKVAQDLAYRHELYPDGPKGGMKAHVVIMSYEAAANVNNVFHGVKWVGLIVDEGQRLKNEETILYRSLRDMRIPCRILLTGTPLQNNKRELFNLLQFIDGTRNAEELDEQYAELTKDNLPELHNLIRPYFLRRTKAQVLKFLPPMAQIILPVTMTVLQEKLSKSIMARNPDLIRAIMSKSKIKARERKGMSNILSDLRQCLCHPFCFNAEVEDKTVDAAQMHRNLVEASPKLLLFEIMLPKLKERGHRVLIFSQYLHSLTILEDFLTGLDMTHARIDGSLSALEKQKRIDAFNAPDSPLFAMLLSTRAGGVGINLASADTVIIYDPDFNPHQDIQALSRAHRIGQKRKVLCFQLMTKDTVEEKIMQMGRKKMALDHALIESMDAKEEASEDLESILKHGAAALFSDESKNKIVYDDASVEKLLDRSQIENTDTGDDNSAETQFSFARVWANDKGDLTGDMGNASEHVSPEASTSIWENILRERELQHERDLAANQKTYGRGARRQGTLGIDYKTNRVGFIEGVDDFVLTSEQPRGADSGGSEIDFDDELYIDQNEVEDDGSDDYGVAEEAPAILGKVKAPKGKTQPTTTPKTPKKARVNASRNPSNPSNSSTRKRSAPKTSQTKGTTPVKQRNSAQAKSTAKSSAASASASGIPTPPTPPSTNPNSAYSTPRKP
ncbi:hypothetical protein O1611_g4124 [Lasiodiplodia mahajangana]|uniref:Uncharacterized protein n=1 Tax=Lasiodiplodia mahajangana TaxID=1108764 RepID=A0ACC2JQF4_9PEZI|nr:hypothetical protein O1611_g4124 [Lasiodiplodia mahajangana]